MQGFCKRARGREPGKAPALCHWAQEVQSGTPHLGDGAPVPPVPSGPRKFLEDYKLLPGPKGHSLAPGLSPRLPQVPRGSPPPIHSQTASSLLPALFIAHQAQRGRKQCTASPGSSPHGSHTSSHPSGEGGSEKKAREAEMTTPSTAGLRTTLARACSAMR